MSPDTVFIIEWRSRPGYGAWMPLLMGLYTGFHEESEALIKLKRRQSLLQEDKPEYRVAEYKRRRVVAK